MFPDTLTIGPWTIEYDRQATTAVHARISVAGPEQCGCWYCLNWVQGRFQLVPTAVRSLLARLGVPVAGETEVYEMQNDDGRHIYGGWYTFVGRASGRRAKRVGPLSMGGNCTSRTGRGTQSMASRGCRPAKWALRSTASRTSSNPPAE
jgi:hypothetical protein